MSKGSGSRRKVGHDIPMIIGRRWRDIDVIRRKGSRIIVKRLTEERSGVHVGKSERWVELRSKVVSKVGNSGMICGRWVFHGHRGGQFGREEHGRIVARRKGGWQRKGIIGDGNMRTCIPWNRIRLKQIVNTVHTIKPIQTDSIEGVSRDAEART